jgi:sugar phosphate isomerase/epimerase
MGPIAQSCNVIIAVEAVNTKIANFLNSVTEAGEVVKAVSHPNVKLLVDIYHMTFERQSPAEILQWGEMLRHVHIAEPENRAAPGTKNFDFRPYLETLKQVGYDNTISIECDWSNMEKEAPRSAQYLKEQLRDVGYSTRA